MKNIYNHISSKLSDLDKQMLIHVPEGGNWKNIPDTVPSKRLEQIRESYNQGKGSRSTYYGRLRANKPSYTINTYFNRPGNGCHIHYSQNRVLSQREAARLQSFPDSFVFENTMTSINNQIGNAVPPLLAYLIAKNIEKEVGEKGAFVDLFSGAGGLGYGFKLAGWVPIVANDIESKALETYQRNVHNDVICGSISDEHIVDKIVEKVSDFKTTFSGPIWVLGGPPCQGFSTAGNKRTMDDDRNKLFYDYKKVVDLLKPDGFVFENVAGLLNIEQGAVFELIKEEFSKVIPNITGWLLNSVDYAIPQRRKRVILVGSSSVEYKFTPPEVVTLEPDWISTYEAISDLPEIKSGDYSVTREYSPSPKTNYQKLMNGDITVSDYYNKF
ncbi:MULTISPECIES: DNA (cytosine-5-)-methyltransferase [Vibrio]|uniref:DNA (cytosine-5-)-methyltransferase n=1 Tax=Vibrio TaxID=662 RepID=UPI00030ADCD2|nr:MULTISPECIES: DNA (cytosine-5-)-methyltransferase [Vibrio]OCH64275.1 DNA (cytosine-5-)-methyltransferase [Vibrio lentus]